MGISDIKINYLFNSGFTVETENYLLIFDYYLDDVPEKDKSINKGYIPGKALDINKKIIVFSSHSHFDHFNPVIFNWRQFNSGINYVLSSEIESEKGTNIYYIAPYENIHIDNVYIRAFGSTDLGVSFLVSTDGISIFHAGDLNWWDWYDDTTENNLAMEKAFKCEISKIKGEQIDIAFFPVDPRLKESFYLGGEYFINEVNPKFFIPMHFGNNFSITDKFANKFENADCHITVINTRGQLIYISQK